MRKVPQLVSNHHAEAWLVVSPVRSPSCPKPGWASEPHHCSRSRGAPATQGNFPDLTFRLRLPPLPRPPLTLEIPVLWPFSQSGLHPRDGSLGSARPLSTRATRALKWPSSLRGRRCPGPATPAPTPPARAPGRRAREFGHCSPALAGGRPRPKRAAGDLAGADGRTGPRRGSAGGGGGIAGAPRLAWRGGAGAEAAANRGSARAPYQPPITARPAPLARRVLCSPLARWPPPRVAGPRTSARPDQARCARVRGPLGGLLASPSDGLLVASHTQPRPPRAALQGRDKALWEAGLGSRRWARRSTGPGQRASPGSTFPSSASRRRCPCCGVSPATIAFPSTRRPTPGRLRGVS